MRRTVVFPFNYQLESRIISAHAENRSVSIEHGGSSKDHLRACGEQPPRLHAMSRCAGSSPRMRRTARRSSPAAPRPRIISAHAENSADNRAGAVGVQDHLRACGEQRGCELAEQVVVGSSPRMRRTVIAPSDDGRHPRIISAHAENRSRFVSPSSS